MWTHRPTLPTASASVVCIRVPPRDEEKRTSIQGTATLGFARWTQRRERQLHRFQNRHKHGMWLLTEKALRCSRPVRTGEEKVMNDREARPLAEEIESSQLMAA